jgi:hypothetical protein
VIPAAAVGRSSGNAARRPITRHGCARAVD